MLTEAKIKEALKAVKYPGYSRDIVSFGLVKQISLDGGVVHVLMQAPSMPPEVARQIKTESERVLKNLPGANRVQVEVAQLAAGAQDPWANQRRVPASVLKKFSRSSATFWRAEVLGCV